MLAYATVVVIILCTVFTRYCPCACAILHSLYQLVMRRLRRPVEPPVATRPPSPPPQPPGVTSHFDCLSTTEAFFTESGKFRRVNSMIALPYLWQGPHRRFSHIDPEELVDMADCWISTSGAPSLTYDLNIDGTVDAVLHD